MSNRSGVLYRVAKQVCHDLGFDYIHPVSGKVFKAPCNRKKAKIKRKARR
jgi:hypothetical protein